ncbi:autotransporter outer membrane beta-barrel domain-containing protein [Marinobacter sp. chi1]|uniref:Autotransporter outer membrane beta-barrel domain-containing protein n=1 Tax=Marinobacter suaedae TaxID=3057675 RepID=A0ABT8VW20_9GAMM|nr:autotransporter outer membrane beta-barrel domain-containing protein [Marinobacter sp. chi1]MDO3720185.1 autotransporter outer membrane beta-barrel domain-containing protein [Marinobacter sp. chi1]
MANQETYNQLKLAGCQDSQRNPTAECGGLAFISWQVVRELVHTANELGGGDPINGLPTDNPTEFSLGLDLEGLGFALRWTAGEEFSAQGDLSESFVGNQLSGLTSRVTALRHGVTGFAFNASNHPGILIAQEFLDGQSGGGAGSEIANSWSPWGSFLNLSYTYGDRKPTQREDAYDFDGIDVTGGVDYRVDDNNVVGLMLGFQDQSVDFDSSKSIVDGGVDMDGLSMQVFYLYQSNRWYGSASLGYQLMEFETDRSIRYPSLNPDVESTNTKAISSTDASAVSASASVGYPLLPPGQVGLEPYLTLDYRSIAVDGYREEDIQRDGFNFVVADQGIDSLETGLGLKGHYVFATSVGVFVPEISIEHRIQFEDDAREITAYYFNAEEALSDVSAASFKLLTDAPDSGYQVYTLGVSAVLRGARTAEAGGAASGGISGFLNIRTFANLDHFSQQQFVGGVRYEF